MLSAGLKTVRPQNCIYGGEGGLTDNPTEYYSSFVLQGRNCTFQGGKRGEN